MVSSNHSTESDTKPFWAPILEVYVEVAAKARSLADQGRKVKATEVIEKTYRYFQ